MAKSKLQSKSAQPAFAVNVISTANLNSKIVTKHMKETNYAENLESKSTVNTISKSTVNTILQDPYKSSHSM